MEITRYPGAACSVVLALASIVGGVPVQWSVADGGNGHYYEPIAVGGVISWDKANQAATEAGGYLVTITSEQENDFVFGLIDSPEYWYSGYNLRGPWIGGFQYPRSAEPDGGWAWVTGEPFVYTSWDADQPNNLTQNENRLHFGNQPVRVAKWNDVTEDFGEINAYVVEYIPEPGSVALLGLGALLLGRLRRKASG
jgi:hypothetical protein